MDPVSTFLNPVVQSTVERVFRIVEYHVAMETNFKDQLEEMKKHLAMMRSYLADSANLKKQKEVLKTTLATLKDLTFEADDLLTDCYLRLEHTKKVSKIKKPFFRYDMGKKLRDLNSRMRDTEATMGTYLTSSNVDGSSNDIVGDCKRMFTSQDFNSHEIIGLEDDLTKMKGWILNSNSMTRIGIVGMGGLGKTTITQKVFNDPDIASHFDKKIWLSVSQAFKEKDMLSSILKQLDEDASGLVESDMFHQIHESLREQGYLVVLDDVWETGLEWWSKVCSDMPIPSQKPSCIIVTTRNESVALGMGVNKVRIHWPHVLDEDDSWSLFCKHAFRNTKGECHTGHFEDLGRKIADKCGGLPLAVKTIGALLASKTRLSEWSEIEANFRGGLIEVGSTRNILASLQLSYAELPSYLKLCLLSFSVYPEDAEIEAAQVVHWWVGEGLVERSKNNFKTAIEYGYAILGELARRCLIEVVSCRGHDGRVFKLRMHDMVRQLVTIMADEEGFCSFDEKGSQRLTLEGSRWLGLKDPIDESNLGVMKKTQDPKLRSLLLVPSSSSTSHDSDISNILELQLKSLRVLDVSHSEMKLSDEALLKSFWSWIASLERLAYLNLSGLASLKILPRSIKKLRNLQLLVLRGCNNLSELHSSVTNLKQLIVLDVGSCPKLSHLPAGLHNLSNLQELSGFRISNKHFFRFLDLKELTSLRVLRIDVHDESLISGEELSALSKLDRLRVLSISYDEICSSSKVKEVWFQEHHVMNMLNRISPPPALQELYLKNYRREHLLSWVNPRELPELRYLSIEEGNIVSLRRPNGEGSVGRESWKIEGLCLKHLRRLEGKWETLKEDMPLIHSLEVSQCIGLTGFPCSVREPGRWIKNQSG